MDTTSNNRLYPQLLSNYTNTSKQIPQKFTVRRRCRSECLQTTITGTPIEPKQFDDLNEYKRKVAQRNMLMKFSPGVLRNQDSVKNIFSLIESRNRVGAALLKNTTKENISTSKPHPSEIPTNYRDFTTVKDAKLLKDRSIKSSNDLIKKSPHQQHTQNPDKSIHDMITKSTKLTVDNNNKRRIRARSLSDSQETYRARPSSHKVSAGVIEKGKKYDLVYKRSRDEKSFNKNVQQHNTNSTISTTTNIANTSTIITTNNTITTASSAVAPVPVALLDTEPKLKIINPHYTKIVTNQLIRPCTPRYPIKTLNGNRKLNSRVASRSSIRRIQNKQMVISNPPRSLPHSSPSLADSKLNADEESDTGCSSLEDDDDFEDSRDDDFNDSLSESEENCPTQSTTSLDKKYSSIVMTTESVSGNYSTSAPLCPSLFPYVPPYITFASHVEKGPPMPPAVTKVLKWKLTTITPIVIRKVLINSGFRLLRNDLEKTDDTTEAQSDDETNDWMGVWGKHMKSPCFKTIRSYQKINHIPGTFQIGRKDRVWRNLQIQTAKYGKKEFGFMPRTYVIPNDLKMLRKAWPRYSQRNVKWIIKPPASARGSGIRVVNRWSQIPKRKPLIVQRYIDRPLLINGSKFDLRLYVLLTSINPLRVYMHTDGLARFASVKYSEKSDTLNDRYMHLTNYSINKLSTNYAKNEDANACKGHKWTIKSLWTHLAGQGIDVNGLWGALRNLVLRTILAGENTINQLTKLNMGSKYNCYELFGIDVLLDSELIPWLLEVNISPSLHSASPLDLHVKGPLVQALLNTSLFQVPPRIPIIQQQEILAQQGLSGTLCYDKRIFVTNLTKGEKVKHNHFAQKSLVSRDDYLSEILNNLTPDDVRCLIIAEDELARCAPLERIFPSATSYKYLRFTETPRYYNRLLDAWEYHYGPNRDLGVQLLRRLCSTKMHLQVPPPPLNKDSENSTNGDNDIVEPPECTKSNEQKIVTPILPNSSSIIDDTISVIGNGYASSNGIDSNIVQ